ncbi:MAG: NIPSNAP family protein [Burkholderiales bacterium]
MIFDVRTYTAVPGKLAAAVKLYEEFGYPVQLKYIGKPLFYGTTEVGALNQIVHVWMYQSQAEREDKRARMEADPAWAEYRRLSAEKGYLLSQENKIVKSTSFSPL